MTTSSSPSPSPFKLTPKLVALDIETAPASFNPTKSDALNPFRSRIAVVSWMAQGDSPKYQVTLPYGTRPVPKAVQLFAQAWRSDQYTIVGLNLSFDLVQLNWHYPGLFTPEARRCQVCSVDLLVRCIVGDYRDPATGTGQSGTPFYVNKRNYLCSSYSLYNLTNQLTTLKLDKTLQSQDWGQIEGTELTPDEVQYVTLDVLAPMTILENLIDMATGVDPHLELTSPLATVLRQRLYPVPKHTEWMHRYLAEVESWYTTYKLNCQLYRIDTDYHAELMQELEGVRAEWLEKWQQLEPELSYSQKTALADKYRFKHVDKTEYMKRADDDPLKPLLKAAICLTSINTAAKQAEALMGLMTPGTNWSNWNSCSGTGRTVTSNRRLPFPNLQSIKTRYNPIDPSVNFNLRRYVVPKPGNVFVGIDMPTAHLRIAFFITKCKRGLAMLRDKVDIHSYVAVKVYNRCELANETYESFRALVKSDSKSLAAAYRSWAKNTVFAWINGAGVKRIKDQIEANSLQRIDEDVVQLIRDELNSLFWEVPAFIDRVVRWLDSNRSVFVGETEGQSYERDEAEAPLIFYHSLLGCPYLKGVPEKYRPYNSFAGYADGVRYTEVPAATWVNVEISVKKLFLAQARKEVTAAKLVIDHYDGFVFEMPSEDSQDITAQLVSLLAAQFEDLFGKGFPHGIDEAFLAEIEAKPYWV